MSRSRPGEGNTMFGGRQKIYKIPVGQSGSVKNFGSTEDGELPSGGNMGGKALYESDTLPSAFQIMREQERQEREKAANDHFNARSSNDHDRSGSPPLAKYNRNRETSSSTTSGPSQPRTSTAATSIASQKSIYGAHEAFNGLGHGPLSGSQPNSAGSDRPFPRAKKMYGQGLEQNQYDSQSSSLQRINSLNRQRGGGPVRGLTPSRSASNLRDGYRGGYMPGGPLYASNGFRAGSPPPSNTPPRMQEFDLGLNDNISPISAGQTDSGYGASPQLVSHISPPMSPSLKATSPDPTLVAALEPNDLGKATASGAFNKPKKQYDEQQYLQRQIQLQEGRNSPSPGPGATARPFSPPQGLVNEYAVGRSRNNSQTSGLSRSNSVMHPWEHQMEDRKMRTVAERGSSPSTRRGSEERANPAMERSFFGGLSGSDIGESESEADPTSPAPLKPAFQGSRQPAPPSPPVTEVEPLANPVELKEPLNFAPESRHLSPQEETAFDSRSYQSEKTVTPNHATPHQSIPPSENNPTINVDPDSPTLGPVGVSNDLSGMVRQHLRNVSGTSSVYPEDSPRRSRSSRPEVRESIFGHGSALDEQEWKDEISHDDHWVKRASQKRESEDIPPLPQPLHFAARHMLEQAQALKAQDSNKLKQMTGNDKAQRILGGEAPRTTHGTHDTESSWQEQPWSHHTRGPSAETQMTANDKAQRILGGEAPRTAHGGPEGEPSWQEQLKSYHTRGPSTETQMERESLANELEARKRAVRNNLQTFAEGQSRDASPAPSAGARTHDNSPARPAHPFSILKKSSKPAFDRTPGKQEKPTKAMKMLGIDPNSAPANSDGPPPGLFMGREQLPDRAMPPSPRHFKQQAQDVRQNFDDDDSPSKRQRALFGSRSRQTPDRPSPSSSKSSSAYSDSSDRHPSSRQGSKDKTSLERTRAEGSEHKGAGLANDESFNVPVPPIPASKPMHDLPHSGRSQSSSRIRSRSNSRPSAPPHFEPQQRVAPPGTPVMINPSTSSRPTAHPHPYSANSAPSVHDHPSNNPTANQPMTHPTMINPHPPPSPRTQQTFASKFGSINNRGRSINKHDISEPTFVSCTSSVDTVSLPPGASLSNGMDSRPTYDESDSLDAPPIPQRDSRRKRTLLAALSGRKSPQETVSAVTSPTKTSFHRTRPYVPQSEDPYEERSTFSADDEPSPEKASSNGGRKFSYDRGRLRKTSSEGGNMNQRAKLQALEEVRPGLPYHTPGEGNGSQEMVGGGEHVQYQAERNVPASAVMF